MSFSKEATPLSTCHWLHDHHSGKWWVYVDNALVYVAEVEQECQTFAKVLHNHVPKYEIVQDYGGYVVRASGTAVYVAKARLACVSWLTKQLISKEEYPDMYMTHFFDEEAENWKVSKNGTTIFTSDSEHECLALILKEEQAQAKKPLQWFEKEPTKASNGMWRYMDGGGTPFWFAYFVSKEDAQAALKAYLGTLSGLHTVHEGNYVRIRQLDGGMTICGLEYYVGSKVNIKARYEQLKMKEDEDNWNAIWAKNTEKNDIKAIAKAEEIIQQELVYTLMSPHAKLIKLIKEKPKDGV